MSHTRSTGTAVAVVCLAASLISCARPSNIVIADAVGPSPATKAGEERQGQLVVYTDSDANPDPSQAILEHGQGRQYAVDATRSGVCIPWR